MSLIPYYLRHLRPLRRSPVARMLTEDMMTPFSRDPFFRDPFKYMRQVINELEKEQFADSMTPLESDYVKVDANKIQVRLDVGKYKPEEIKVKTVGDEVIVEGKREVREGDGWSLGHFERRFLLPEGFPAEKVECQLDAGKLLLVAFRDQPLPERDVPVRELRDKRDEADSSAGKK